MTDTTQPPAETLAIAHARECLRTIGETKHVQIKRDALETILAALTRRAGGDAAAVERVLVEKLREVAALEDNNLRKHGYAVRKFATEAADYLAAPALPAPVVEGWQEMGSAPNHDGAKIIGFDERWGVAEMMRDGSKLWVLASFNGQVIHCNPVRWQSTPPPPAALSEGRSHG